MAAGPSTDGNFRRPFKRKARNLLLHRSLAETAPRGDFHLQGRCQAGRTNESAPTTGALPNCIQSDPQAATLVGWTSRTLLELAIGIARGFIASGISRSRSMCRRPFSRLAPL